MKLEEKMLKVTTKQNEINNEFTTIVVEIDGQSFDLDCEDINDAFDVEGNIAVNQRSIVERIGALIDPAAACQNLYIIGQEAINTNLIEGLSK